MVDYLSNLTQIKKYRKSDEQGHSPSNRMMSIIVLLLFLVSASSQAATYYSRTNGGNWNVNTTWSTVAYGNATNTGTFPQAGDVANIGDGYTLYINAAISCATINIGQGVSGVLEFKSTSNYTLNISGNITTICHIHLHVEYLSSTIFDIVFDDINIFSN